MWNFLFSQQHLFEVKPFTTDDGLANLYTTAIFQDSKGFIWIGTKHGLNRYDGYHFKLYNRENNGLNIGTSVSKFTVLAEDTEGNIWVQIRNQNESGFDIFSPLTEKAVPLENYFEGKLPFQPDDLWSLCPDRSRNIIYLITKQGTIFRYQNNQFGKVAETSPEIIHTKVDKQGHF